MDFKAPSHCTKDGQILQKQFIHLPEEGLSGDRVDQPLEKRAGTLLAVVHLCQLS